MRIRTHAKVNLYLRLVGPRPDGYHEIETILHGIDLADEIEITPAEQGVHVDMEFAPGLVGEIPPSDQNFVTQAVAALAQMTPSAGLSIKILKAIPIGAGLGGGSGNAAGVLVALNEMWKAGLDQKKVIDIATTLGSDVPYCVQGGTVLALGRGEKLTRLPSPTGLWLVLGLSHEPLFTKDVYDKWDEIAERPQAPNSALMTMALGSGDVEQVALNVHNDLEAPALMLRPELAEKKERLREAGALAACLSGSGPTLYGIAGSEEAAEDIARRVQRHFDRVLVASSSPDCIEWLDPVRAAAGA